MKLKFLCSFVFKSIGSCCRARMTRTNQREREIFFWKKCVFEINAVELEGCGDLRAPHWIKRRRSVGSECGQQDWQRAGSVLSIKGGHPR